MPKAIAAAPNPPQPSKFLEKEDREERTMPPIRNSSIRKVFRAVNAAAVSNSDRIMEFGRQ
jgi:hypothetical protein